MPTETHNVVVQLDSEYGFFYSDPMLPVQFKYPKSAAIVTQQWHDHGQPLTNAMADEVFLVDGFIDQEMLDAIKAPKYPSEGGSTIIDLRQYQPVAEGVSFEYLGPELKDVKFSSKGIASYWQAPEQYESPASIIQSILPGYLFEETPEGLVSKNSSTKGLTTVKRIVLDMTGLSLDELFKKLYPNYEDEAGHFDTREAYGSMMVHLLEQHEPSTDVPIQMEYLSVTFAPYFKKLIEVSDIECKGPWNHRLVLRKGTPYAVALYTFVFWLFHSWYGGKKFMDVNSSLVDWSVFKMAGDAHRPEEVLGIQDASIDWELARERLSTIQAWLKKQVFPMSSNYDMFMQQSIQHAVYWCTARDPKKWSWEALSLFYDQHFTEHHGAVLFSAQTPEASYERKYWESEHFDNGLGFKSVAGQRAEFVLQLYFAAQQNATKQSPRYMKWYEPSELEERVQALESTENRQRFQRINLALLRQPLKVFSPALDPKALEHLHDRFPMFSKVTTFIQQQMMLARLTSNPIFKLPPILLTGKAGIGKTRYLSELAMLVNAPFKTIGLSSATSGWILGGMDFAWRGGKPGMVFETLMNHPCANPVFLLDEIDKASTSNEHSPIGALYQLLESQTAQAFVDEAAGFGVNTTGCVWFATANDVSMIPTPIRSRFQIFEISDIDPDAARKVSRSVYQDLRAQNEWGNAFDDHLHDDVVEKMQGLSPRDMRFTLLQAMASAAQRYTEEGSTQVHLQISAEDMQSVRRSERPSIGFH